MNLPLLCVICLQLLLIVSLCEGKKKKTKKSSDGKQSDTSSSSSSAISTSIRNIQELSTIFEHEHTAVLFDKNFSSFVSDRPREYYAALLFTATGSKYRCAICLKVKPIFDDVAKLYHEQYEFNSSAIDKRIAFFRVEVDNARNIFSAMELETVPRLYILPPTLKDSPKMKMSDFEIENRLFMEGSTGLLEEILRVTQIKIEVMVDPQPFLLLLGVLSALLALFVTAARNDIFSALLWYQSPKVWIWVSAICFGVGVSGSIFCIIRSAPPFGMTRNGLQIFAAQGRDQYMVEGIIVALWTLGCGLSAYLTIGISKLRFPVLRHVLIILCMAIFTLLLVQIFEAYRAKTAWYTIRDTMPGEVWTWLTQSVKKNTMLPKRLYRLSEIWLLEYKDWDGFQKKFKLLVVDYVMKFLSANSNNNNGA